MAGQRTLVRAERLLRTRRYAEVISLLEPQVFLYRESYAFYRILGIACLYTGDYGGAHSYLQRANQLKAGDVSVLLGLAAVQLRRRAVADALMHWLEVLDIDPRNSRARRGLNLIRSTDDTSEFVTMGESGRLSRLYPPIGVAVPRWIVPAILVMVLVAAGVLYGPAVWELISARDEVARQGVEELDLSELPNDLTDFAGEYRYVLSDREVGQTLDEVGRYFNQFRDNLAMREVNRLLNSNAAEVVKERVRLLSAYFREPTFVTFQDNFSFADVASEPWLYDGCYVRWRGQVSNLQVEDEEVRFTFLVGYEDERVLDGTVPVVVPFTADLRSGPIELIGRVLYRGSGFALRAAGIRRIAPGGSGR